MNILLEGQPKTLKRAILGYIVLSAKKLPEFPLLHSDNPKSFHIPGSSTGIVCCSASEQNQMFNPSRSVSYNAMSSQGYATQESLDSIRRSLQDLPLDQDVETPFRDELNSKVYSKLAPFSCLVIESSEPVGVVMLMAKDVQLYLYGLFNEDQSMLVFTNMENFSGVIQKEFGDKYWLSRFNTGNNLMSVIFTRRVCSRWYWWSQKRHLASEATRFAALERSILRGNIE